MQAFSDNAYQLGPMQAEMGGWDGEQGEGRGELEMEERGPKALTACLNRAKQRMGDR